MNANSVNHTRKLRWDWRLEVVLYAVMAACLIGHVFFIDQQINALNVSLILIGIIFAYMATSALTPIANSLHDSGSSVSTNLFSFVLKKDKWRHSAQDTKHTA